MDKITDKTATVVQSVGQQLYNDREEYIKKTGKYTGCAAELGATGKGRDTGRGEARIDDLHGIERERLFNIAFKELEQYPGWQRDLVWARDVSATSSRAALKKEAAVQEYKDYVAGVIDDLNNLFTDFKQATRDMRGQELVDYRRDTLKEVKSLESQVANRCSEITLMQPTWATHLYDTNREFAHIVAGHKGLYKAEDKDMLEVVDSWEELCPEGEANYEVPDMSSTEVREKFLGNVKLSTPFVTEVEEVVQSASHPQMHASRVAASLMMYMNAAKKARALVQRDPTKKVAIVDMGAGAFGGEKLLLIKQNPQNAAVYVHAAIPTADTEDQHRVTRMRTNPTFMSWNDVSVTHQPVPTRLNWCRHKARDCTCMALYDVVFVVCVHSSYYFTQADFERIFQHTSSFEALEHIPELGVAVPVDKPEYVWEDSTKQGNHAKYSVAARLANKVREAVTWTKQVRLQPLVTAATTYHHPDNGESLRRGGFHPNLWARTVDNVLETDGKLAAFAAGVAAAGAIGGLVGSLGQSAAVCVGAAAKGALSSLALTTAAAAFVKWDSGQPTPWLPGPYTVEKSIASSYENGTGDQTCHIVRYYKLERGTRLEPRIVQAEVRRQEEVGRVAAAIAVTDNTPRTERMMAAVLLRDNVPARAVKGTLAQAKRVVDFLFPAPPDVRRPPWLLKGALAVACQPIVSGISNSASSALVAAFCPSRFYLPVKTTYSLITMSPAGMIYLTLAAPCHLLGLWVVLYLSDLMLSV